MTVPAKLETYKLLSLEEHLRDNLSWTIIEAGMNKSAVSTDEEWVEVHRLSSVPENSRATRWVGADLYQITCVSRTANARADTDRAYPWTMAGTIRALLQPSTGKGIHVSQLGDGGADIACMTFPRIDETYLPDYQTGGGAGGGVDANPSNLHAVALTVTGVMAV